MSKIEIRKIPNVSGAVDEFDEFNEKFPPWDRGGVEMYREEGSTAEDKDRLARKEGGFLVIYLGKGLCRLHCLNEVRESVGGVPAYIAVQAAALHFRWKMTAGGEPRTIDSALEAVVKYHKGPVGKTLRIAYRDGGVPILSPKCLDFLLFLGQEAD